MHRDDRSMPALMREQIPPQSRQKRKKMPGKTVRCLWQRLKSVNCACPEVCRIGAGIGFAEASSVRGPEFAGKAVT